ncbi:hypothetical protein PVAR5_4250 [Paecilomyces variotii No. 5]|uniref:Uncharacterized protein n=1 Tax=Byssochlamys spectabilis (strain No. 5 / NBRC 109023) TaxID=1356009 RepID=V5FE16_BYSSN|nr:hypothetical protein PVAR5_4250 [Paecilomyces variotii No. 5]
MPEPTQKESVISYHIVSYRIISCSTSSGREGKQKTNNPGWLDSDGGGVNRLIVLLYKPIIVPVGEFSRRLVALTPVHTHPLALQDDGSGIRDATRQILKTPSRSIDADGSSQVAPCPPGTWNQSSERAQLWLERPGVSDHEHQRRIVVLKAPRNVSGCETLSIAPGGLQRTQHENGRRPKGSSADQP